MTQTLSTNPEFDSLVPAIPCSRRSFIAETSD